MEKRRIIDVNKKGLTPIIATVLLIAVSLALAVIVFMWARGFIDESILKNGRSIEDECRNVVFAADYDVSSGNLSVENLAEIPIYGFEIKEKTGGDVVIVNEEAGKGIGGGESEVLKYDASDAAEELIITPILLGEDSASRKKWLCGNEFAQTIEFDI